MAHAGAEHALLAREAAITITGQAPALEVTMREVAPREEPPAARSPHEATVRTALVGMGYRGHEARLAVDRARAHVGRRHTIDELLKAALRAAPKPRGG